MHNSELVKLARARGSSYYFDTVAAGCVNQSQRTLRVDDAGEHRLLRASLLQLSRYDIANRGHVNEPEFTMGSGRDLGAIVRGAAAGTVTLGEPPRTEEFERHFDWPDALIRLPFDSPDVGQLISRDRSGPAATGEDSAGQRPQRRPPARPGPPARTVFDTVGIAPTEAVLVREKRLQTRAAPALEGAGG